MATQDSSDPSGVADDGADNKRGLVRARERKANAALQLRLSGASWDEIAEAIGYPTARQAIIAVEQALERNLQDEPSKAQLRTLAGQRLDRLLRSVWVKAVNPENPEHMQAITKAREIIAQQAKLYGLDAPTELVVHSPTQTELEAWVADVAAAKKPKVREWDIFDDVVEGEVISDDGDDGLGGVPAVVNG